MGIGQIDDQEPVLPLRGIAIKGYKGRKPSVTPSQSEQLRQRARAGERKTHLARDFRISKENPVRISPGRWMKALPRV